MTALSCFLSVKISAAIGVNFSRASGGRSFNCSASIGGRSAVPVIEQIYRLFLRRQLKRSMMVAFWEQQGTAGLLSARNFRNFVAFNSELQYCMKLFSRLRMPAALAIALFFIGAKADAQSFG